MKSDGQGAWNLLLTLVVPPAVSDADRVIGKKAADSPTEMKASSFT